MDNVPDKSAIDIDNVEADQDVRLMLSKTTVPDLDITYKVEDEE